MRRANPFEGLVAELAGDEPLLLREAVDEMRRRDEIGFGTQSEAAAAYRPEPGCPGCGARGAWWDGPNATGVPR